MSTKHQHTNSTSPEFPASALGAPSDMSRRDFVSLVGATVALAGLSACVREPAEKILPYVDGGPDATPGAPLHFATSMTLDGYATGLLVTSHGGRPTKIEGNPEHPASLGAAGVFEQASVLQLYDPDRARYVQTGKRRGSWRTLSQEFSPATLRAHTGVRGAGLALLLAPTASPLISTMLDNVRNTYPDARTYFHDPLLNTGPAQSAIDTLGDSVIPQHDFRNADVIVSLGADFCAAGPFNLRYARDFGTRRRASGSGTNTLYVAECAPSPTGTLADHRIAASPATLGRIASALLQAMSADARFAGRVPANTLRGDTASNTLTAAERAWVKAAAADLAAHPGHGVVIAGPQQPAELHSIVHALNAITRNTGSTVRYTKSQLIGDRDATHDLAALNTAIQAGGIDTLLILDGNPVYSAPADVPFRDAVGHVRNSVYLGLYNNETAKESKWMLPAAHYLESWGDGRAYDGTASLVQPLIAPLYGGRTVAEFLALIAGQSGISAHDLLQRSWRGHAAGSFGPWWDQTLARGVIADTAAPSTVTAIRWDSIGAAHAKLTVPVAPEQISMRFVPSPAVHDGQFANNGWLQELPHPITKLTWDNAAMLGAAFAERLGVARGDEVELKLRGRSLRVPALIVPGHANDAITLALGYGRAGAEGTARGVGSNANLIRTSSAPFTDVGVTVTRTGAHRDLAITQEHWSLEGRGDAILGVAEASAQSASKQPQPVPPTRKRRPLTLYEPPAPSADGFGADQWAMVIDLNTCTGCNACVVACQAENNIPVVGRESVLKSREMQWMRIDRYVEGPLDDPQVSVQPMLCQQCEKAPCEYVCPVDATVHSDDGLNEMIYNRCVGTRFCSNNCPYKVRRFNWFDYNGEIAETERMVKNPEVTIRSRGVMEKCTFCVQRIRSAQIDAQLANEPRTGPVVTACQQTCPTGAIIFGSLTDPSSEVVRLREDPRCFSALDSLGTVPRVRYLARDRADEVLAEVETPDEGREG